MKDKGPGHLYKKEVMESGCPYTAALMDVYFYLVGSEPALWAFILKRSNITNLDDGSFYVTKEEIAQNTGLKEKTIQNAMKGLIQVGLIERHKKQHDMQIAIRHKAAITLSKILNANPGIGPTLRKMTLDKNISVITNRDVEKACIEYGVKFTWVDGLNVKTLPPV